VRVNVQYLRTSSEFGLVAPQLLLRVPLDSFFIGMITTLKCHDFVPVYDLPGLRIVEHHHASLLYLEAAKLIHDILVSNFRYDYSSVDVGYPKYSVVRTAVAIQSLVNIANVTLVHFEAKIPGPKGP
jgi:hypothetical protein